MIHDSERGIHVVFFFPQLSLISCFLSLSSFRATRKDHALHLNTFQESWGYQKGTRTKSGQSASLMRDSPAVFLCYIRTQCQLQTKCCRVHLEAAPGNRSHTRFDWHVLTSPNEPNFKADSHAVNRAGLLAQAFYLLLPYQSHRHCLLFLSLFLWGPLPHPPSSASVPTVPPGNVQAEAVNSTTVRFTWSAPSPQFINGINQGYKVSNAFLSSGAL